jgi:DNA modification methylase
MSGKLVVGDCVYALNGLPGKCADLVFADPLLESARPSTLP